MTRRGIAVVQELQRLRPDAGLAVVSCREEPWEPAFFDELRTVVQGKGGIFHEARKLTAPSLSDFWTQFQPELLLMVNWRTLVGEAVTRLPTRGSYVFHDSLLPEYRGFSPTVWAMVNGEDHTGATLIVAAERADEGDVVDQRRVDIAPGDYIAEVQARVTEAYIDLVQANLDDLLAGRCRPQPQDHSRATYAHRRLPDDNLIDWNQPSHRILNLIRAVSAPYPGAYTYIKDRRLTVWRAGEFTDHRYVDSVPGAVCEIRPGEGVAVATREGAVLLTDVQVEGEPARPADEVVTSLSARLRSKP